MKRMASLLNGCPGDRFCIPVTLSLRESLVEYPACSWRDVSKPSFQEARS